MAISTSRRRTVLPAIGLEALREHRKSQEQMKLEAGDKWQDIKLVFIDKYGRFFSPDMVLRRFWYSSAESRATP